MKYKKIIAALLVPIFFLNVNIASAASFDTSGLTAQFAEYQDRFKEFFGKLDEKTMTEAFDFLQKKASDGSLETEAGTRDAIDEGRKKFDVQISEKDLEKMIELIITLEEMGFDSEKIIEDAKALYEAYGADFVDHTEELVTEAIKSSWSTIVMNAISRFFQSLGGWLKDKIVDLFANI
jgi:uncharacterized protein YpuA (DUF1002 family)